MHKKNFLSNVKVACFLLFFGVFPACAETINIPADILNQVQKITEENLDLGRLEKLILNQTIKRTSIMGVSLKNFKSGSIIDYLSQDGLLKKVSDNKLVEPTTGATLIFQSENACTSGECVIIFDMNGDNAPNELWTNPNDVKDRVMFKMKQEDDGSLSIEMPNFLKSTF